MALPDVVRIELSENVYAEIKEQGKEANHTGVDRCDKQKAEINFHEDDISPYSSWKVVTNSQAPTLSSSSQSREQQYIRVLAKRKVILILVVIIFFLLAGIITSVTIVVIQSNQRHSSDEAPTIPSTSRPTIRTEGTSISQAQTSESKGSLSLPTATTEPPLLNRITAPITTSVPSTTTPSSTAAPTSSMPANTSLVSTTKLANTTPLAATSVLSTTSTVQPVPSTPLSTPVGPTDCSGNYKCHSCSNQSDRCPEDGQMGDTEKYGQTEVCSVACFAQRRENGEVHRGCVHGKGSVWEDASKQLTCQEIETSRSVVCFCCGTKCNEQNITAAALGSG